ncbi:hypothetical protein [Paenibacillus sp. NRS-1760]|uniref:hypothetical protein n=1 Tax=Paenibacillus sp. NRS-1760 TaxID=3233902 RepID=UPI003D2BD05D
MANELRYEEQMVFFPPATAEEIKQAKSLLMRYRRQKFVMSELEQMNVLSPKQELAYNTFKCSTLSIERAVRCIINPDIQNSIEMRFIEGIRRKDVVTHYRFYNASTVDRRIKKGIIAVANILKEFEF